jgi:hypothetical protein
VNRTVGTDPLDAPDPTPVPELSRWLLLTAAPGLETRLGLEAIGSGESFEAVERSSDAAGRHGRF